MADYSMQDKLILNRTAALCREYRFYESRRDIVQTAGLPPETAKLSISELRQIVDSRIANKVTPPVVGEMLRIESTFRHIRDIHNYNCRQAGAVIGQLDRTLPCLDNKNLWFAIRKMEQIYHLGGYEHFRYKLNEHPKAVDKVRLLNRMLKDKKNPLPAPNYAEEIKRQISTEGIRSINEELKKPKSAAEKIHLNEEKIYLIDNSGWSRSQRFLAKTRLTTHCTAFILKSAMTTRLHRLWKNAPASSPLIRRRCSSIPNTAADRPTKNGNINKTLLKAGFPL